MKPKNESEDEVSPRPIIEGPGPGAARLAAIHRRIQRGIGNPCQHSGWDCVVLSTPLVQGHDDGTRWLAVAKCERCSTLLDYIPTDDPSLRPPP